MSAFYALLEQETLLHIKGPDTLGFLQGQTTCDTRTITPQRVAPGAYCTPKGRMVCDFLLGQLADEHFALRLRSTVAESAAATFGKYIVFSKADFDSTEDGWQAVGLWGESIAEALAGLGLAVPAERHATCSGEGFLLIQLDDAGKRFELWCNQAWHATHFSAIRQALSAGSEDAWYAGQILAGIGQVEGETTEAFLPQDLNFDVTGHVNFSKGCYTGQEIVARLHYRGKAKRRAHPASLAGTEALAAGTPLFVEGGTQSAGTVVNSAVDGDRVVCLVSATSDGLAQGLRAGSAEGPVLTPLELPYSLEES